MKKLILILTLLISTVSFGQSNPLLTLFGSGFAGNLFTLGGIGLLDVNGLALKVSPPPFTLTQTGAEVQTILDGTFGAGMELWGTIVLKSSTGDEDRGSLILGSNTQDATLQLTNKGGQASFNMSAGDGGTSYIGRFGRTSKFGINMNTPDNHFAVNGDFNFHQDTSVTVNELKIDTDDFSALSAEYDGLLLYIRVLTENTGATTLLIGGLAAKTIKKMHDQNLASGDIEAGHIIHLIYDQPNDVFQLLSPVAQ